MGVRRAGEGKKHQERHGQEALRAGRGHGAAGEGATGELMVHPGAALAETVDGEGCADAGRGFGHRQASGSEGRRWWLGGCH